MGLRYASKQITVTGSIGTVFPHGLGTTPDEYFLAQHGASAVNLVLASAPDSTNIYVSAAPNGGIVSVFAAVNHSQFK